MRVTSVGRSWGLCRAGWAGTDVFRRRGRMDPIAGRGSSPCPTPQGLQSAGGPGLDCQSAGRWGFRVCGRGRWLSGQRGAGASDPGRFKVLTKATPADLLAIQLDDRGVFLDRWQHLLLKTLEHPTGTNGTAFAAARDSGRGVGRPGGAGKRGVPAGLRFSRSGGAACGGTAGGDPVQSPMPEFLHPGSQFRTAPVGPWCRNGPRTCSTGVTPAGSPCWRTPPRPRWTRRSGIPAAWLPSRGVTASGFK